MPGPRRAAALTYDGGATAPKVVAAASGEVADRIVALARERGVPVREDAALAEALARLELEADAPPELWTAVAEALVWAYRLSAMPPPRPAPATARRAAPGPRRAA